MYFCFVWLDKTDVIVIFRIDVYFVDIFVDYPVKSRPQDSVCLLSCSSV